MLLFTCQSCGERIVTFEATSEELCPNCGETASAQAGLRISIPLGLEDFPELRLEARGARDDLVRLSTPSTFIES